ncbi:hypothetical protein [Floridanema flaviceps]
MEKCRTIIQKFSSVRQLTPVSGWVTDRTLEKNMKALIQQYPEKNEKFWVTYWLDAAKNGTDSLAVQHLRAYLEEACWQSAKATYRKFSIPDFSWLDYWQIARQAASNPVQIFKNYDIQRGLPSAYAQEKLSGAILDIIRKGQETQRASDWGLLRKLSKKALKTALQTVGIDEPKLSGCVLAWQAFQEVYAPPATVRKNQPLPAPTDAQLADIATYYNEREFERLRTVPLSASHPSTVSAIEIQKMLTTCINAVRANNKIGLDSLNANNPALELETANYSDVQQWHKEEQAVYSEQWEQLRRELSSAIAFLPPTARTMLILEHGLIGLNQSDISKEYGLKQYQLSRQLSRHKGYLLETLAQWSQKQAGVTLNVEKINHLSQDLDLWIHSYCQTTILHRFLQTTLRLHPTLQPEIPLLRWYYGENLPALAKAEKIIGQFQLREIEFEQRLAQAKQILQKQKKLSSTELENKLSQIQGILQEREKALIENFQLTESQFEEKLKTIKQVLQDRLQQFLEKALNLSSSSQIVTAKPLAELIETWLSTAQYSALSMKRRQ